MTLLTFRSKTCRFPLFLKIYKQRSLFVIKVPNTSLRYISLIFICNFLLCKSHIIVNPVFSVVYKYLSELVNQKETGISLCPSKVATNLDCRTSHILNFKSSQTNT